MNIRKIFQIFDATKKQRELITSWANKAGKDPTKIIEWVESTFKSDAEQFAAAKWVIKGYDPKVFAQALYICQQKKLDPQGQNPEELVANNADIKKKEKPINPDDVLTDKQEDGEGNVTYAARDEDRKVIRQIINTHFGVDANPWCLMQAENGVLIEKSMDYWKHYSAYPKRIAFRNGKLLAFSAGEREYYREYWDRMDRSFPFIPYNGKKWQNSWGDSFEIKGSEVYKYSGDRKSRLSNSYAANVENASEAISVRENDAGIQVKIDGYFYPCIKEDDGSYTVIDEDLKCTVSPDLFLEGHYKSKEEEGEYKKGKKEGVWKTFGDATMKKKPDGSGFIAYRPVVCTITYKNGKKEGEHQAFYNNGQLSEKCFYKDDKKEGEYQSFFEDGQPWVMCSYKNGKMDGKYQELYDNGQHRVKAFCKNGKYEGEYQKFYPNGQLCVKGFYKDGEQEGEYRKFYDNGQLHVKAFYKDGKREGECQMFYYGGNLYEKSFYKEGKMEGEYLHFYENGQLYEKCFCKNGYREGEFQEFYETGQLYILAHYKDDEYDGVFTKYNKDGSIKIARLYEDGECVDDDYVAN